MNGDDPFLFFKFIFVSVLVLFKQSFVLLFILPFFVTRTKIRNRKAVFPADGPVEGSETLHDRVGVLVSSEAGESVCVLCHQSGTVLVVLFCFFIF